MRWTSEEIAWCCCSRRAVCNSTQIIGIGEESTDFRHFKHVKITETGVSSLNSFTHSRMVSPIWSFSIAKALCSFNVCSTSEAASGELNASSSDWKTADYAMMKKRLKRPSRKSEEANTMFEWGLERSMCRGVRSKLLWESRRDRPKAKWMDAWRHWNRIEKRCGVWGFGFDRWFVGENRVEDWKRASKRER